MKWPFVTRRRFDSEVAALRGYNDALRERSEAAEANERTERIARKTITRQHAELDAVNRRLAGRNAALSDRLEAAQVASGFDREHAQKTANRLARLQRAVARARAEAAAAPEKARTDLYRSEKARAALEEQCLILQRSNEFQAAALLDKTVAAEEASAS